MKWKSRRLLLSIPLLFSFSTSTFAETNSSLPTVTEGPKPGPPALYAPPATTAILENTHRWNAKPLMISGAEAYQSGEYVYQDYLYDDYGANTTDLPLLPEPRLPSTDVAFSGQTGDVVYPTNESRYGYNAADLVEFRVDQDKSTIAYRFTLNTLLENDSTAIAVGIDINGGSEATDWGHNIGTLGPLGLDHILYTDGVHAELDGQSVDVATSLERNQITVTIPRSLLNPENQTWEHYLVTGIADGHGGFAPLAELPSDTQPGGKHLTNAPPVFNVGFRFEFQNDEPMGKDALNTGTRGVLGYGSWRDHGQAKALAKRDISNFAAAVNFEKMSLNVSETNAPKTGYMNRIYVSSHDLGEGVADKRPWLLGKLQPYTIYVPRNYDSANPPGLQLILHSLGCNYNQFGVFSPNIYQQLGEERGAIAFTTMGRGPDGWYAKEAELDVFEAWADIARTYRLDSTRVGINGYSMGGYGTFKLVNAYPDLFGKAFPVVGPAGEGVWLGVGDVISPQIVGATSGDATAVETNTLHLLENFRNVPAIIWNGGVDELVPITGAFAHANRFYELGYRFTQDVFTADHFLLLLTDQWARGKAFLGDAKINRNPSHVTYKVMPSLALPEYGLVQNKAYWLWDIEVRDTRNSSATGLVDAKSVAFGEGAPLTKPLAGLGIDPLPYVERGLEWISTPIFSKNKLEITLTNISSVTIGLNRAKINTSKPIVVQLSNDGVATINLAGKFLPTVKIVNQDGDFIPYQLKNNMLSISVSETDSLITINPY